jgi:hypothetical protein
VTGQIHDDDRGTATPVRDVNQDGLPDLVWQLQRSGGAGLGGGYTVGSHEGPDDGLQAARDGGRALAKGDGAELLPLVRAAVRFVDDDVQQKPKTTVGEVKENAA